MSFFKMADVESMPADRNLRGKRNYRRYETLFAKKDSESLQRPHMIEAELIWDQRDEWYAP